nr:zinc knuckle CX2CX4HX4C [Tanacetum cinerariifolium]
MEEYIRLEEEKARRCGKMYNWETATYGKISDNEDIHDLGSVETEFLAIVLNDALTSEVTLSCAPTNTSYPHQRYAVYNTLVNKEEPTGTIAGVQQDTTVRVYPNPNSGFVDSTIEGHGDGDQSRASIMFGSARVSRDEGFTNPKNTDHEFGGPTSVRKWTLQNLKSVPSTYDSGVHLNNMKSYEAFNITLSSVEGLVGFFRTASKEWKALMDLKLATPDLGGDPVITKPNEVSPSDPIAKSVDIYEKPRSFVEAAGASAKDQPKIHSNFHSLVGDLVFDGVNIFIPRKVIKKVSTRFEHTLYGYFIGKRMAFSVVEYYARSNWVKHGLNRIMMNSKGFFFFKFDSQACLEAILEGGPWLIQADLVDVVTIGVPLLTGDDFTREIIHVEYESRPPRCDVCKIFGHLHDYFPKKDASPSIVSTSNVVIPTVEKTNDGFQTMGDMCLITHIFNP